MKYTFRTLVFRSDFQNTVHPFVTSPRSKDLMDGIIYIEIISFAVNQPKIMPKRLEN